MQAEDVRKSQREGSTAPVRPLHRSARVRQSDLEQGGGDAARGPVRGPLGRAGGGEESAAGEGPERAHVLNRMDWGGGDGAEEEFGGGGATGEASI